MEKGNRRGSPYKRPQQNSKGFPEVYNNNEGAEGNEIKQAGVKHYMRTKKATEK